jgi:Holliday junction resolvase-like predicted endonuclease
MVFVTKFDGRTQPFIKGKIINTCLRIGVGHQQAVEITNRIEREASNGITTKEVLKKIFDYAKKYKPEIKDRTDLRSAIAALRSKPDFEIFVSLLLKEYGYEVQTNQIVDGKCVDHEIDAIAKKDNEIILVEAKHHEQYHTYTGVSVFLEVQAELEDLMEGYRIKKNKINFTKALVVCNTKISEHAERYATCRDIGYISWKLPKEKNLEQVIEDGKLYPITLLRGLDIQTQDRLVSKGILLLKQLIEMNVNEIAKKTGIEQTRIKNLVRKAKELLS